MNGFDLQNRPILYLKLGNKKMFSIDNENKLKYLIFINLKALSLSKTKKLTYIIDLSVNLFHFFNNFLKNCSLLNLDGSWIEMVFSIFQNHFPNTLGSVHVVNYPSSISNFWNLISVGLNDEIKQKIKFSKLKDLNEIVDKDQLEKDYGGKSKFKLDQQIFKEFILQIN